MAASSKTIMDLFKQPAAKRLKRVSSPAPPTSTSTPTPTTTKLATFCSSSSSPIDGGKHDQNDVASSNPHPILLEPSSTPPSILTAEEKSRIEFNKALARARRNLKLCSDKIAKCEDVGCVKLEELLVEETWLGKLPGEFQKPYAKNLFKFVESEIQSGFPIYPPQHLIFNALNTTPFDRVKVVIIGQGVLLLNAVLTVKQSQANSHANKGWEQFTDAVIRTISQEKKGVVFLLWGNYAQAKARLINETKHHILKATHPSGLSANRGFFGCRHFSRTNQILEKMGISPIIWQL
ncbi:uracil-DNA glycosylase, mitochondrial isoform X2 [Coffea arabica]|uniref:Uracil-DNA glycosylase, mitochondrial isoform X2 n=1 Tax=Coffea arabica TaxID=13443 RepID=A0ABM4W4C2_COFAR